MMQIDYKCPDCGAIGILSFSERIISDELRWSASHRCPECDYATELDDIGALPNHLRNVVLQTEGKWQLKLARQPSLAILKALKVELNLSLEALKQLKENIDKYSIIGEGTKTEMVFLKHKLEHTVDEQDALKVVRIFAS
ncbi:MAG: hypothetical protein AAFV98_19680 [Chloroflexota bacterium]